MQGEASSRALEQSFLRYREKKFNKTTDDALKEQGQKILDKYAPENNKNHIINTHSVFWMVASFAVFYYTDFYLTLMYDTSINRFYMYSGIFLLGISTVIGVFLISYYHYYLGITDYEKHVPYAVPIATISFIAGMIVLCVGLWPVWNIFTPFILFMLFMGFVFLMSILPI